MTWHNDSESGSSGRAFRNIISLGEKGFLATGDAGVWAHTEDGKVWNYASQAITVPDRILGRLNQPAASDDFVLSHLLSSNGETRVFRLDLNSINSGWSEVAKINNTIHRILYVAEENKFYSFGNNTLYSSTDGTSWSTEATNINSPRRVFYSNGLFASYIVNNQGEVTLLKSENGRVWLSHEVSADEGQGLRAMTIGTL